MKLITVVATTIDDAWFQCISLVMEHGREFKIDYGSFAGQKRKELDYITIQITHPGVRPLVPQIPPQYGIPNPTSIEYVEQQYLPYLMVDHKEPDEDYTYGMYIEPQLRKIIERYRRIFNETGGYRSNQEYITVSNYLDHLEMKDPPCLRGIDTRIQDNMLHFFCYFRSWDLFAGFPSNLAGIQLMKEYMASEIGVQDGELIAASKGLHLYDHFWPLANVRLGKKNEPGQIC